MGFWFYLLVCIIAFTFFVIVRRWHDYSLLFTIAIGFAVNANIFNAARVPVYLGSLVFAIDSILYTGFMFAVIICAKEYGVKKAKILTSSTIAAILVSSFIEFFANISSNGYNAVYMNDLLGYILSAVGTFVGVWVMLFIFQKLDKKQTNIYLSFLICILIASVINSTIYYSYLIFLGESLTSIINVVLGSYIGKVICIVLGQTAYYINTHYWIPLDLMEKYKKVEKND